MSRKLLSFLGIAKRAGKIKIGTSSVENSIDKNESKLILFSCDISVRSKKNIELIASEHNIDTVVINESMDQIGTALGTKVGVISINDENFMHKILELIYEDNKEECNI